MSPGLFKLGLLVVVVRAEGVPQPLGLGFDCVAWAVGALAVGCG
ncbi:hypothetical protein [Streptomyces sp. NPDC019890]